MALGLGDTIMDTPSNAKNIKVFMSKYPDFYHQYWYLVKEKLIERDIEVHTERIECDVAIVLNAAMFNPSVFKNKIGFLYSNQHADPDSWDFWVRNVYMPVLEKYFDPLEDLFPRNIGQSVDRIIECMNEIN